MKELLSRAGRALPVILALLFSMFSAYGQVPWDGTVPQPDNDYTYSGGKGTAEEPFLIATAADLAQLAANVNNRDQREAPEGNYSKGKHFRMTGNINLGGWYDSKTDSWNGPQWVPIGQYDQNGNASLSFAGVFDGNGFSIANMYIADPNIYTANHGLFGTVGTNEGGPTQGTVKNLTIASGRIKANISAGSIAGTNYGNIVACRNRIDIIGNEDNSRYCGGIAGSNLKNVRSCLNTGDVQGIYHQYIGGITTGLTTYGNYYVSDSKIGIGTQPQGIRVDNVAALNDQGVIDEMNAEIEGWNYHNSEIATPFRYVPGINPETDLPRLVNPSDPTDICETAEEADITVYSSNGTIVIEGIAPGAAYSITGFTGITFDSGTAADDRVSVSAPKGFYIVKAATIAEKVEVK